MTKRNILLAALLLMLRAVYGRQPAAIPPEETVNTGLREDSLSMQPADLRCEYLKNPLGIDLKRPRFSWGFFPAC